MLEALHDPLKWGTGISAVDALVSILLWSAIIRYSFKIHVAQGFRSVQRLSIDDGPHCNTRLGNHYALTYQD